MLGTSGVNSNLHWRCPEQTRTSPLDLLMTQYFVHRMGKIDSIVRLDALKIVQIIKRTIERGFFSVILPP